MRKTAARVIAALAVAVAGLAPMAGSAEAAKQLVYTKGASVPFVELGAMDGAPGNAHSGYLTFYQASDGSIAIYGYVFHYDCPTGFAFTPTDDSSVASAQLEAECSFYTDGSESYETGDLDIRMTGDQRVAHVSGYYDSSLIGQPTVAFDLTFRGFGAITETNTVNRGARYKQSTRERSRAATVTGVIGGMGLGDEADDLSFTGELQRNRLKTFTW